MAANSTLVLNSLAGFVHQYHAVLDVGFLVFVRILGFTLTGPLFGRKDLPFTFRLNFAIALTLFLLPHIPGGIAQGGHIDSTGQIGHYILQIIINIGIGLLVGFVGQLILEGVTAAGALANNQIGLSAAMTFDPSTRQQVSLLDKFFGFLALIVFFHVNGLYWILGAFYKTFTLIPLYHTRPNFPELVSGQTIIQMSANTLDAALLMIGPIFVVTIAVDMILGIVNRTAQQIQVFQLSYALKPAVGLGIFWMTLPNFLELVRDYLEHSFQVFT